MPLTFEIKADKQYADIANVYIKTLRGSVVPEFEERIHSVRFNEQGKLLGNINVKEAVAQLKGTIAELNVVRDMVQQFMDSPGFSLTKGLTYEPHKTTSYDHKFFAVEDPSVELEVEMTKMGLALAAAERKLETINQNPELSDELVFVSDRDIIKTLEKEPDEVTINVHERERDPIKQHNLARIAEWNKFYGEVTPKEGASKLRFGQEAAVSEYESARFARKDFTWNEKHPMIHVGSSKVETKTRDWAPGDLTAKGLSVRGGMRFADPLSKTYSPVEHLNLAVAGATEKINTVLAGKLGIDGEDLKIDSHPSFDARQAEIKEHGQERAAQLRARRVEKEELSDRDPKETKLEIKNRAKQEKEIERHGYAPIIPRRPELDF